MIKPNLILLHSYPTNSLILEGLISFLKKYFKVYFIDLPGFIKNEPPLKKISIEGYTNFIEKKVEELNLKNFWIGGISFGFLLVNKIKLNKNCKGIFAVEPFLNYKELKMNFLKKIFLSLLCGLLSKMNFKTLKNIPLINSILKNAGYPKNKLKIMKTHMHPKTIFGLGKIILGYNEKIIFHKKPYILVINKEDETLDSADTISIFKNKVKTLQIINTTSNHYPKRPTKRYFEHNISKKEMEKGLKFMKKF